MLTLGYRTAVASGTPPPQDSESGPLSTVFGKFTLARVPDALRGKAD
jgi:hypothetical protein